MKYCSLHSQEGQNQVKIPWNWKGHCRTPGPLAISLQTIPHLTKETPDSLLYLIGEA